MSKNQNDTQENKDDYDDDEAFALKRINKSVHIPGEVDMMISKQ